MGAANVAKVYVTWRTLDDRPMRLLVYMAMRALDHDSKPWYGAGHEELAQIALGLDVATEQTRAAAHRAVRRAMTVLLHAGAVTTDRHAAPGRQATYRLHLDGPTQDGERPVNNHATQDGERPVNKLFTGRSAVERRTLSGQTQDAERPTKEEEEEEERTTKETLSSTRTVEGAPLAAVEPSGQKVNGNGNGHKPSRLEAAAWQAAKSRAARGAAL